MLFYELTIKRSALESTESINLLYIIKMQVREALKKSVFKW